MSQTIAAGPLLAAAAPPHAQPRVAAVRAVLALLWAAALVIAVGDAVPGTDSDVPVAAAALLATYPAIDVVASLLGASAGAVGRALRVNAAIGVVAVAAIATAAFGADAGATLAVFGAWAAVSGAMQLGVAVRRRAQGRQLPLIVSGGLSTVAGLGFVLAAGTDDADLTGLAGYMALGALLFLVFAFRTRRAR